MHGCWVNTSTVKLRRKNTVDNWVVPVSRMLMNSGCCKISGTESDEQPSVSFDTEKAWQKSLQHNAPGKKARVVSFWNRRTAVAAVLVLIAGVWWFNGSRNTETIFADIAIRHILGNVVEIYLRKGSVLTFPQHFANSRRITLSGEAFFEIAHDEARPLNHRIRCQVRVMGAQF